MTKVTAGVLTGVVLGAVLGIALAWGEARTIDVFTSALGRASQGIINGVLAAYVTPGRTPVWRGMLLSGLIGAGLGGLAGIPDRDWQRMVPFGALIGAACGAAAARAGRKAGTLDQ